MSSRAVRPPACARPPSTFERAWLGFISCGLHKQFGHRDREGVGQPVQNGDCGILQTTLNSPHISAIYAGEQPEGLLGQVSLDAKTS
jgi:hypothetical protein